MGSAIHSQTPLRLRSPLPETGFLDRRFDRHLIKLFMPTQHQSAFGQCSGLPLRLPARHRVTSIPTKTTRRFDCLNPAKIEDSQIACDTSAVALLAGFPQDFQPGGHAYSACRPISMATVSCQRQARLRWLAGRRVRTTGAPAARAARSRAWRSVMVYRQSIDEVWVPLRNVTSRNGGQAETASAIGCCR
jgi:hypothetical protein